MPMLSSTPDPGIDATIVVSWDPRVPPSHSSPIIRVTYRSGTDIRLQRQISHNKEVELLDIRHLKCRAMRSSPTAMRFV
jgi:hypothetical protein